MRAERWVVSLFLAVLLSSVTAEGGTVLRGPLVDRPGNGRFAGVTKVVIEFLRNPSVALPFVMLPFVILPARARRDDGEPGDRHGGR